VLTLWVSGTGAPVNPETSTFQVKAGDIFLLCSDGLYTMVPDSESAAVLADLPSTPTTEEMSGAAARLIGLANENGGADNISAVVVRCIEEPR
jgi:protein phosphatase